jgi:acylphosphatase
MMACRRFVVSGRVQGVAYRAWTRMQADALGLTGWAMNRDDGRVEVLACGEAAAVDRLHQLLREGPPAARVTAVDELPACTPVPAGFAIR